MVWHRTPAYGLGTLAIHSGRASVRRPRQLARHRCRPTLLFVKNVPRLTIYGHEIASMLPRELGDAFLQDGRRLAPHPRWCDGGQGVRRPHSWLRFTSHDRPLAMARIGMTNAKAAYIHHAGPAADLSQLTAVSTVVASAVAISPGCLAVHQSNP